MQVKPRFELGEVWVSDAALDALASTSADLSVYLSRHVSVATFEGYCVMSSYPLSSGKPLLIITEADRSMTTVLVMEDF